MQNLPTGDPSVPLDAKASVLVQSAPIPANAIPVRGPDLATPEMKDVSALLDSYKTIGFQATSLHRAIEIVQNMVGMSITVYNPLSNLIVLYRGNGRSPMSRLIHQIQIYRMKRPGSLPNAPSSWDSRPISCPRVSAKYSSIWSRTSMYPVW